MTTTEAHDHNEAMQLLADLVAFSKAKGVQMVAFEYLPPGATVPVRCDLTQVAPLPETKAH
jgi:hypothetical protein